MAVKRRKKRDYKAEYARRLERARKLGYSKAVARGHAKLDEMPIKLARKARVKPGSSVKEYNTFLEMRKKTRAEKKKVFGRVVKRTEDQPDTVTFEAYLEEQSKHPERGQFNWTNEGEFIRQMQELGFDERQAYNFWFS